MTYPTNKLLILDDFGLKPMDANTRLTLLDLQEDRYAQSFSIITSQHPVASWYDYINEPIEPTLADAIMGLNDSFGSTFRIKR